MWRRFESEKILILGLLVVSVVLNIFLSIEVYQKRALVQLLRDNRKLTIGEVVSPLVATNANGDPFTLDLRSQSVPTIVYYSSSTCHWCTQNAANIRALAQQAEGKYGVIFLSDEKSSEAEISAVLGTTANILYAPTVESKLAFDLTSTPTTLLLSANGKIQKIWKGAYGGEREVDIEETIGIKLPGVPHQTQSEVASDR